MSTLGEIFERFADELDEQPYLRPFVEDGDEDLTEAQRRYEATVREALVSLRSRGIEVRSLAVTVDGRETTMLVARTLD